MPKTALVIGNSSYLVSPLLNPANDAKAMSKTLTELGFEVDEYTDLDLGGMNEAIRSFGNKLKQKRGLGLFFYAGHGMQIEGNNYLIPVKNGIEAADEVTYKSINADMVLRKMESAGNNFNIVIMDACRNNPFPKKFRSAEQGLARMDAPTGSIIAYATAPGSTAADGIGNNGLYTSYLLKAMKKPGLSVEEVFKEVRIEVLKESEGRQTPWESSSLTGNFEFLPEEKTKSLSSGQIPPPPVAFTPVSHLQVISNIIGAKVFVNGLEKGIIPKSRVLYLQNLENDAVEVRLEKEGYSTQLKKINLKKGEWQQAYFEFLPESDLAIEKEQPKLPSKSETQIQEASKPDNKKIVHNLNTSKETEAKKTTTDFTDLFKKSSSGIETTEISPEGHFSLSGNQSRSQINIPKTDTLTGP